MPTCLSYCPLSKPYIKGVAGLEVSFKNIVGNENDFSKQEDVDFLFIPSFHLTSFFINISFDWRKNVFLLEQCFFQLNDIIIKI
jgi:hypothetical protein